jgi:dTDP-4-dehydrorhamnose 3,5-epimerase
MKFIPATVIGAYIIEPEPIQDSRGFFARSWCAREFEARGLSASFVQANIGLSHRRGTLRGLHYQLPPRAEVKLVRCTRGAAYDVIVDLRPTSPTYRQWFAIELTADDRRLIYVPPGVAHGYQTLTDGCELFYETTEFYCPDLARGIRYDDPAFGIVWPLPVVVISDADLRWPAFNGRSEEIQS